MADLVTLWIGEQLGAVERACLRSMLRHAASVALYCYREPAGVPEGVLLRNAADILAESNVIRHRRGSVGLFSDWFRYELQRLGLGTWVDTDVYLIKAIDEGRTTLFGELQPGLINGAVLRLPQNSPLLPDLLRPFELRTTPSWLPWYRYFPARLLELVRGDAMLENLRWGELGPFALTALARRHSLASEALPQNVFYPVPWQDAGWIRDPGIALDDVVTEETVAVHLWNECIREFKDGPALEGSFLSRLQDEGR